MNKVLKDLPFAIAYLDNIIIYSKTAEEHLDHLQQVFHKCHNADPSMKFSQCYFFAKEKQYWGHALSTTGIKLLPSKMAAIKLMKPLKNAKQVRAFLGLLVTTASFIKNFTQIVKPLTANIYHDLSCTFTDTQQKWSRIGSLWHLLHCNKLELLSTRI